MLALPGRAQASEPLFASEPLDDEELAQARGGFTLPNGIEIGFGAMIATSVAGEPLLRTEMQLTDQGLAVNAKWADGTPVTIEGGTAGSDPGQVTIRPDSPGAAVTVSVKLTDLFVRHTVGSQISSLVANTADGAVIDSQMTINLQLDNVNPLALGSAGFQIEALGIDAASFRTP